MVDPDVITRRVLVLGEVLQHLQGRLSEITAEGLAADPMLQAAVERWLQVAIESCIDIAYHIVAERGWTPPDTARGAFQALGAHAVIPHELAVSLGSAAGMRNILVHDYVLVNRSLLAEGARAALTDLQAFGAIAGRLIEAGA